MVEKEMFTALLLEETGGRVSAGIRELPLSSLPDGDVTVEVLYSNLNYKDGMVLNGLGSLVRAYPHIPGVDFAGRVLSSDSERFKPGDEVILTGWRVGEIHWGGYATRARVKADWLVPLPQGLTLRQAMAIGTAGLAAMLSVMALEEHGLTPDAQGEVLVTGAAGGVGSVSTAILSNLGYRVAASTGRKEAHNYLKELGAAAIISRFELEAPPEGPIGPSRWCGAIDSVAGMSLAALLGGLAPRASCAAVGLAGGLRLETTMLPFLLRGVNLLGIDTTTCPMARRKMAWERLEQDLPMDKLERMVNEAHLAEVPDLGGKILHGQVRGRIVINLSK